MHDQSLRHRHKLLELVPADRLYNVAACAIAGGAALAIAFTAWNQSLWHLDVPPHLAGDALSVQHVIKTIIDHGWYLVNPDLGAPFAGKMYDFPMPNSTLFAFIRLLGLFSKNPFVVFNLFYLAGFAGVALAACWAFIRCGIPRSLALAGAIAYAILPFHFLRLDHTYLAFYFSVPIFCCYALRLAVDDGPSGLAPARLSLGTLVLLAIAAGGGVYYAFFGCLFIATGAICGAIRHGDMTKLRTGALYVAVIVIVIGLNLVPNFLYHLSHGANHLVAHRNPAEAEIYGLRITQMLLPTPGHRSAWASTLTSRYSLHAPLVNENATATLGVLGSLGFLIALAVFLFGKRSKFPAMSAAGLLSVTGVLYATIGGFGALMAFLVMPELRGLNRISVFIAFFGLFALLTALRIASRTRHHRVLAGAFGIAIVVVAWADQVPVRTLPDAQQARQAIAANATRRQAYDRLQASVPPATAIYQLPYVFFPESPDKREGPYTLFIPYLYTHGLRWSFGGTHGRAADVWNERVSHLTGPAFANALAGTGFGAVYVDGAGYKDDGAAINEQMTALFGPPVWRFEGETLYRIPPHLKAGPYTAVAYGQGWYGPEGTGQAARRTTWQWSSGNATLEIANPGKAPTSASLRFTLDSFTPRKVDILYNGYTLGTFNLRPGSGQSVRLSVTADPGSSQIRLVTDKPGKLPGNGDQRKLAFRLIDLVTNTPSSITQ